MRLHHVGVVVENIAEKAAMYRQAVPIGFPGEIVLDETQRVRVAFADVGNGVTIEFIEPYGEDSPVTQTLRAGGALHHVCYEVEDIEGAVAQAVEAGAIVVCAPVAAPAFDGRRVAFIYPRVGGLIEFVEAEAASGERA